MQISRQNSEQDSQQDLRQKRVNRDKLLFRVSLLVGVILLLNLLIFLLAEGFWFAEVDYLSVYLTRLLTQVGIGLVVFGLSLGILWLNLTRAEQRAWPKPVATLEPETSRLKLSGNMRLLPLLAVVLPISLLLATSLLYYAQVAATHWRPAFGLRTANLPVPLKISPQVLWNLLQSWQSQPWQPFVIVGLMVLLLIYPRFMLRAVELLISLGFGLVLSEHWDQLLLALHRLPFNETEPLFQQDIGFYVFALPVWELLEFWLVGLAVQALLAATLIYLLSADSLSQGYFPGFSAAQVRYLCQLSSGFMLILGLSYWIDRYELLYSPQGAVYGASYTDVTVQLPVYTGLSGLALLIAVWLLWRAGRSAQWRSLKSGGVEGGVEGRVGSGVELDGAMPSLSTNYHKLLNRTLPAAPAPKPGSKSWRSVNKLIYGVGGYLLVSLLLIVLLPIAVQQFVVQPNELQLEQPYIQRAIALTRQGFKLDEIDVQPFELDNGLTVDDLRANNLTIENIRLWDRRPLLETNRQLQRIRLYYEFPDADIDRYPLPTDAGGTFQQQVLIAARELDYNSVPAAAQTWVNRHLIYTHGYGFTVSPVNTAGEGGLPDYLIRGIEDSTPDPRVQSSIPIGRPRIYYGELTDTYVMTKTRIRELDYPSGSDNVYNTYDGWGGVDLGNWGQRLLYAAYLRDWRMLFTENFLPQTKLLFRRNITQRVRAIAPFLRYDNNPYLVVVDTGDRQWQRGWQPLSAPDESNLYWIIDAYTTSDRYPYSDPLDNDFNYIRNSVKVVVDAYHGSVNFYVADPQDPIIQAWSNTFPGMFQPLAAMPAQLQRHIRYPQDFFAVQSNQLMTYHMTDPVVFYNREDQWRAPNEIYADEQQLVEPYYLIMKLPIADAEEFILLRPFTPAQRNNLVAWLAARSDRDQYGRMLLYVFSKQSLVFGPEQVEARINQDPLISEQISLWNRQGSRAAQGNLLVIPIEQSLLYVEPIYLVAEQNQLPTLVRVIVVYGSRIAMAETLEAALDAIFTGAPTPEAPPILRDTEPIPGLETEPVG